ncbi:hypothetical protein Cs7R123_16110 [Catellatospora sp. TT07R-123]|uniref:hypothetical protein n=1 Tax=Catellatospora sp. TT07R-123 TaxID=2733863 RepID=UPI001B04C545|nr:hypothetical protein [Catellatospora sp. TT07R-123]GHJ44269.1 hypothetical protein Cs7R123_16110 [Catellatospora sp. TT07R-123]
MTGPATRPLLFLDVDGPLNPYAAKPTRRPDGYQTHRMLLASMAEPTRPPWHRRRPLRVWLHPGHGPSLLALPFDLVWATSWTDEANEWISPRLGLPELPVVPWPVPRRDGPGGVFYKTAPLVEWAAGRPFAWVDDDLTDADAAWVRQYHAGPALLHRIDPKLGLRDDDFTALSAWAAALV